MVKQELIERSPVRIFEKSIHGGLKSGEIGVIASPSGLGKTSVLVQIALDKLLQNKKVIHVSFSQHTDYVLSWYTDIFDEFTKKKNLVNVHDIKDELIKNRVLMNFNQDGVNVEMIIRSIKAMIVEGRFDAEAIIVDGLDFSRVNRERLQAVRQFAQELNLSIWYSCNTGGPDSKAEPRDKQGIPSVIADFIDLVDVVIALEPKQDYIELTASKYHGTFNPDSMALRLDPKTLLIMGN